RAPGGSAVVAPTDLADTTAVVSGGESRSIITIGVEPTDAPLSDGDTRLNARRLGGPGFVLIDTKSKPEYGPAEPPRFGAADIGVETDLGPRRVRIVGLFEMGAGMACNGACMTSLAGYYAACPWQPPHTINLGLVSLGGGAAPPTSAAQQLRAALTDGAGGSAADSLEVLTRAEVNAREERRWMDETPFGKIFGLGVLVAILVGVAIVYQVLSSDIANLTAEYATLRALGYPNSFLAGVVLRQSLLLAIVGYAPSLAVSVGLYAAVGSRAGIPMVMTPAIALSVLALTLTMCVVSGVAALRKLFRADPADLF
ncbi:MAG: FtsX-like permease family protein, partial [Planctomycetota bacterium]